MTRKQFTFYRSYAETIENMQTKKEKLQAYEVLTEYALFQREPDLDAIKPTVAAFFRAIKPALESAYKRSVVARESLPPVDTDPNSVVCAR